MLFNKNFSEYQTLSTGLVILITVFLQLERKIWFERGAFLENYLSKFFTDEKLYRTFHELVYTYPDETFRILDGIREEEKLKRTGTSGPVFEQFEKLQGGRKEGSRFYHPELFQGSPEEERLDALFGYFYIIAYRYHRNLISLNDIIGSVGYHLSIMGSKEVISRYLEVTERAWRENPKYRERSKIQPHVYLNKLLNDMKKSEAYYTIREV